MEIPPILLIAFNRPLHTKQVFEVIKKVRPKILYISVDGPRQNNLHDFENINKVKEIITGVDWPCKVYRLFQQDNVGCKIAVSTAITWFFENEEYGIILEDDCLPSESFFKYCWYLLEKYKENDGIMHINGVNFQDGIQRGPDTYYFSRICHVWGWATWRRAWRKYDIEMNDLEKFFEENIHKSIINYPNSYSYWQNAFTKTKAGGINTWDYQWVYSVWKNNGLSISPNINLISNIGFDLLATHTKRENSLVSKKSTQEIIEPYLDLNIIGVNYDADKYIFKKLFSNDAKITSIPMRIVNKVYKYIKIIKSNKKNFINNENNI